MAKIRLTKNEFKKQKDALKRYVQYLPVLLLKKQQLQTEILKLHHAMEELKRQRAYAKALIYKWVDVFAEDTGLEKLVRLEEVVTVLDNIAGIDVPVFDKAVFREEEYDPVRTPLWLDYGIEALKKVMTLNAKIEVLKKQDALVREELRITTQRVNLFEKVLIPEKRENIRKIQIYLGDMRTAAVVTGKIAKEKILKSRVEKVRA
ncbi:MAG: V-type ATP synthase subunit D [Candidatus Makaraimicrobium thalassicum]|nr:MAG: V-type ATP synthase subunit D [Candidatus Omnitrophota bacterium]